MYIGNQPLSVAFLTDQFSGNGSTTAFTLSVAPANTGSILVAVSGVLQDPSTYAVTNTTLTFSAAPPAGTGNISVRYLGIPASGVTTTAYRTVTEFTATAGQTTFSVPSYTVGYISVFRNGVRLGSADYTATSGTSVILASAATAGDLVVTESFYVSSVLNAIPATAGAVNSTYIADNAITTAKIAPGAVVQADLAANVAGNGPAFHATFTGTSVFATVNTEMAASNEAFDTASAYSTSTGRFTPQVAGYYQFNATVSAGASGVGGLGLQILKNSGTAFGLSFFGVSDTSTYKAITTSAVVFLNGSTDYVSVYAYVANGSMTATGYFSGALIRSAT